eukprot:gene2990-3807_t
MLALARDPKYSDVANVRLGPFGDYVFLLSPGSVRNVTVDQAEAAFPRRFSVDLFETLGLNRGIVYAQGSLHKEQKKRCVPSFENVNSMRSFLSAIQEESVITSQAWRSRCDAVGGSTRLDVYDEARRLTLAVVLRVTFGVGDFAKAEELSFVIGEYLTKIVATANELPPLWRINPALSSNYSAVAGENGLLARLRSLVLAIIAERRAAGAEKTGAADLLGVLIDSDASDDAILYTLFDLIIAGSDTTASTVTALLFLLHRPGAEEYLAEALQEASSIPRNADGTLQVSLDDCAPGGSLAFLTRCARETLRLYPPVPFIGRDSVAEAEVLGYGPRGCLGTRLGITETVVAAAVLLRDFDFEFDRKGDPLRVKYDLTLNLE